jgi:hypothetical protein
MAFALGPAVIVLPARVIFEGIFDLIFGKAKTFSGGMTVVAALPALVALVAIDGPVKPVAGEHAGGATLFWGRAQTGQSQTRRFIKAGLRKGGARELMSHKSRQRFWTKLRASTPAT